MEKLQKKGNKKYDEDYLMAKAIETQVTELRKDISHLTELSKNGFKQIRRRQDIANGKISKHCIEITKLNIEKKDFITREGHLKIESDNQKSLFKRLDTNKTKLLYVLVGIMAAVVTPLLVDALKKTFGG